MADAVEYHEGERPPTPPAWRPSGTRCECHLARATSRAPLDYRRAMRRVDVIAVALAVAAGHLGVSAGTGPLAAGIAVLVLVGLPLRARTAQYIVVWAVAPLLVWATYPDSVGDRSPRSRWPAARDRARCSRARARRRRASDGHRRRARHARRRDGRDRRRAALVRPAAALTASSRSSYGAAAMSTATVDALAGFSPHARRWFEGALGDADARADAGLAADRRGRARAAVRADRLGQDAGGVPVVPRPRS